MADIPVNASDAVVNVTVVSDGQTVFDYDFRADEVSDLRAIYNPGGLAPPIDLVGGVDFTATGLTNPTGGTITLVSFTDTVTGQVLTIYRNTIIERLTDFQRDLWAASLNSEFDQVYMIMQELRRALSETLSVLPGQTPPSISEVLLASEAAIAAAQAAIEAAAAAQAAVPNSFPLTRPALKALNTTTIKNAWFNGSQWTFRLGNYAAQVAADTVGALFMKANDTLASVGAWVRDGGYYTMGRAKLDWFDVPSTGAASAAALTAALTIASALGITRLEASHKGVYPLENMAWPAGSYDIDWNGSKILGTYTNGFGHTKMIEAVNGTSSQDLAWHNVAIDGGWGGVDTTATARVKLIAIKDYRTFKISGLSYMTGGANGTDAVPTLIFNRADMYLDIWNVRHTTLSGLIVLNNRRYECIVIKSDDCTHTAEILGCSFFNQPSSGSPVSGFNLANFRWVGGVVDGWNAGANILCRAYQILGVTFRNITDNGLDCFEAIYYAEAGLVDGCTFTNIGDIPAERALLVAGNVVVSNCHFRVCQLGLCAETTLAANAKESAPNLNDAAWGPWCSQRERSIHLKAFGNTFEGILAANAGNVRVLGNATSLATFDIEGADCVPSATQPANSIRFRYIRHGKMSGVFLDGSEATFRHDLGEGDYEMSAVVTPRSGADVFRNERAAAQATSVSLHWTAAARRVGNLLAGKYDIAKGSTPETYTNIRIDEGTNRPTIDTANISFSTTPFEIGGRRRQVITADSNFNLAVGSQGSDIFHTGTLTAARSVSLLATNAVPGDQFRVTRTGGGAFNLNVGTGPLKALATNQWCIVEFTDAGTWVLKAFGSL